MEDILIPVLILAVIVALAFVGYRALTSSNRASQENAPGTSDGRPLGDTDEAHDEISPHDLPLDNPGRHKAEEMAGHEDATTRGMAAGAGATGTARFSSDADTGESEVGAEEARDGAKP